MTTSRTASPQRFLMCRPEHFDVAYRINPWMDLAVPVDRERAIEQWDALVATYRSLGHEVELVAPEEGLPDMVFTANAGLVLDGKAYLARFRHEQRWGEERHFGAWFREHGYEVLVPQQVNEGEGDLRIVGDVILAGSELRTSPRAHAEVQKLFDREVVTLELVDPSYYHLDTALAVLDRRTIAYLPGAFSERSQALLAERFPDALIATPDDAAVLGLNATSDGANVVLPHEATGLAAQLEQAGFHPIGVDVSELLKAGGGPKCCTLHLR